MYEARQRENSSDFQESVWEQFRLIACKSCTMNVKLQKHHINELSAMWSEFPQNKGPSNSSRFAWLIHPHTHTYTHILSRSPLLSKAFQFYYSKVTGSLSIPKELQHCLSVWLGAKISTLRQTCVHISAPVLSSYMTLAKSQNLSELPYPPS